MAIHFHPLTVTNIYKETPGCSIATFKVPDALKDTFAYAHGQSITLKTVIDGQEIRRSYSICSAPFENTLSVAVKNVAGGKFSNYVNTILQTGDTLEVLPPTGNFNTPVHAANKKNYLAIAAGSGITPVISIIKTVLAAEQQSTFTLVYGNQSRASIIFFEALANLKNKYLQRFTIIHILSREQTESPVNFGRINAVKLAELQKVIPYSKMDDTFICGPQQMLFCAKDFLTGLGIDKSKIHFELFNIPGSQQPAAPVAITATEGEKSAISIRLDGRTFNFDLAFNNESILDAALKHGADLPYACKGGVCCTCRAQLVQGEVKMDVNYALEKEELAKGFILTCQSHPLTSKVVIDFDTR